MPATPSRIDDVTSVLGLVGRDLVFDMLEAIAAEDAAAAFALVETAIERGYDLRLLCRELARATRDLLLVSVDPARLKDPDVASESERAAAARRSARRFSREDLLRAFDGFTRAEYDVRQSDHPRFQLEMALLRLMHLRKLVPLAELLDGGGRVRRAGGRPRPVAAVVSGAHRRRRPARAAAAPPACRPARGRPAGRSRARRRAAPRRQPGGPLPDGARERFLAGVKAGKVFFFNAVVAQAYRIDVTPARITFAFLPNQKVPRAQCEENREWLDVARPRRRSAARCRCRSPRPIPRPAPRRAGAAAGCARAARGEPPVAGQRRRTAPGGAGRSGVQALFEIFPVERTKIEEM